MYNTLDALGNEIVMGKRYGYAISSSGVTTIVTGIAKKFTPKGLLTLIPETTVSAVYMNVATPREVSKTVSVKPLCLFPIA